MALKPLPRLIIIAIILGGAAVGYTKWQESRPKVVEPEPVVVTPMPVTLPLPETKDLPAAQPAPEPAHRANVSSGSAGMAELLKNAKKK